MLWGIRFLMTVSLILSAALAAMGTFFAGFLSAPEIVLHGIDFVVSGGIIGVLSPRCTDSSLVQESIGAMSGSAHS
jgi:hypothetical protein